MNDNLDFESYANQIDGEESTIPVSPNGVYDHPYQNVIVPTQGNITMKNVDYPILGISMETGQRQMMLPGDNYNFENTQNVLEIPQFQNGGKIVRGQEIKPVELKNIGKYTIGLDNVDNTIQLEDYERPNTSRIKNFEDYVLNEYREWGDIEDFTIVKPDGNEYLPGKTFGKDQGGNYVDMSIDGFFSNGNDLRERVYIPDNIQEQISLEGVYDSASTSQINTTPKPFTQNVIDHEREFMRQYVGSDAYRNKLGNYYSNPSEEQRNRLGKINSLRTEIKTQQEMDNFSQGVEGTTQTYADNYGNRYINPLAVNDFIKGGYNKNHLSESEMQKLQEQGILGEEFGFIQDTKQRMQDGLDNSAVYFSDKTTTDGLGVHEISHYMKQVPRNQYEDILSRTMNTDVPKAINILEDGRGVPVDYLRTPTEVVSRLDALRFLMKEEGIKDTTKDLNISEKDLEKALQNPRIKNNEQIRNLINITPDSQKLLWLLNNIVDNRKRDSDKTQYMG